MSAAVEAPPAERTPGSESATNYREALANSWRGAGTISRVYLTVGLATAVVYFFAPQGWGHHLIYDLLGLSCVVAILYGIRLYRPAYALPWYLFAFGNLAFVIGDMTRAYYMSPAPFDKSHAPNL